MNDLYINSQRNGAGNFLVRIRVLDRHYQGFRGASARYVRRVVSVTDNAGERGAVLARSRYRAARGCASREWGEGEPRFVGAGIIGANNQVSSTARREPHSLTGKLN